MKQFLILLNCTLVIVLATSKNIIAQNQVVLTNSAGKEKMLSIVTKGIAVERLDLKVNGKVIATSGSSRTGVTVAGGHCQGSEPNQLNNPNGVFVDKDDNIWVADASNGRVQKFTPGSENAVTIGADLPNAPNFPTNVFVNENGDVYVADYFAGKVKLLRNGGVEWINVAGQNDELDLVRGVWVDRRGNVYCTQYGFFFNGEFNLDGMILKYPPNSSAFEVVAGHNGTGSALNQFSIPTSVMLDDDGNIYVADGTNDHGLANSRIMKWLPGAKEGIIVAGGNGEGDQNNQCPYPVHAFIDKKDLYVSHFLTNKITKWKHGSTTGEIVAGGNGGGSNSNQLSFPFGIFVKGKYLYVTDAANHRIQRFDLNKPDHLKQFVAKYPGTYTAVATFADGSVVESDPVIVPDSKIIAASTNGTKAVAYPNPATNSITVDYPAMSAGKCLIELTDITGRTLLRKQHNAMHGSNTTSLDVSPFAYGTYFIKLTKPDGTKESIQVIKKSK